MLCLLSKILAEYLVAEMQKEEIEPDEFDDKCLTLDVRDMMEMEVQWCICFTFQITIVLL